VAGRQLYFSPNSPYARKVRIVLAEKGLAYEAKLLDPHEAIDALGRLNPNLRVPVLADGDRTLFESNVIVDYLLRTYPATPQSPIKPTLASAVTREDRHWDDLQVLVAIETLLDTGINLFQLSKDGLKPDQAPYLKKELMRTQTCLDWLESHCTAEGFVPGQFSVQDLNLVCALTWADFRKPFSWKGRKNLERVVEAYSERPSIKTTRPGI
jgi:glutathione S-transferase